MPNHPMQEPSLLSSAHAIRDLYRKGLNGTQIAQALGITKATVSNVKCRWEDRPWWTEGLHVKAPPQAQPALVNGHANRGGGRPRGALNARPPADSHTQRIRDLTHLGHSPAEIAAYTGVRIDIVKAAINRWSHRPWWTEGQAVIAPLSARKKETRPRNGSQVPYIRALAVAGFKPSEIADALITVREESVRSAIKRWKGTAWWRTGK